MAYTPQLYTRKAPTDDLGADVLIPVASDSTSNQPSTTVDIYRDYNWTLSNKAVRLNVPYVELTEYKQVLSSEISGFFYNLSGKVNNIRVGLKTLGQSATEASKVARVNAARTISDIFKGLDPAVQNGFTQLQETANQATTDKGITGNQPYDRNLVAYTGLYALDLTGWSYTFPYLTSSNMVSPSNVWGEQSTNIKQAIGGVGNLLGGGAKDGDAAATGTGGSSPMSMLGAFLSNQNKASNLGIAMTPGALVSEDPKSFTSTGNDSVTIVFYLYNTQNYQDIRSNWEFCYLFTYQNLANRKGVNLLDPPCLYRVLIPGYKQLPLCWVSDLKIENKGAVRLVDIDTGADADGASSGNIKMIPEAYKVSITLESVLMNARNIFTYGEDPSSRISVSTTGV